MLFSVAFAPHYSAPVIPAVETLSNTMTREEAEAKFAMLTQAPWVDYCFEAQMFMHTGNGCRELVHSYPMDRRMRCAGVTSTDYDLP